MQTDIDHGVIGEAFRIVDVEFDERDLGREVALGARSTQDLDGVHQQGVSHQGLPVLVEEPVGRVGVDDHVVLG